MDSSTATNTHISSLTQYQILPTLCEQHACCTWECTCRRRQHELCIGQANCLAAQHKTGIYFYSTTLSFIHLDVHVLETQSPVQTSCHHEHDRSSTPSLGIAVEPWQLAGRATNKSVHRALHSPLWRLLLLGLWHGRHTGRRSLMGRHGCVAYSAPHRAKAL